MRELTNDLDNLRIAWIWAIKRGKYAALGRAIRSFGWYFEISGLLRDGIEQLELLVQALRTVSRDTQKDRVLGSTLVQQGLLYFRTGQFIRAHEVYEESIALLRSVGEQVLLADALIFDGIIVHYNSDYLGSKSLLQEGLANALAINDPWFTAYGIYGLGHVDSLMGEYEKGYEQMQASLKIWRMVGG